ncbi:RNA 2',3'-cyclic phosphodiesterase [Sporolactobacillus sp. CQH2019]|uniref:RNA 2',3'-cyclic phosphodiesterase n=1 Tax=Sporolactobacillus sp. CQH2019 TaxID=3023512 RepID=UPI0023683655|nr:RNA 2',3'-cyclic phosphodiesterase [Sporolactobacillus sp. CQH2019]MDD9149482.1 RNA 2',3'-cyclic phosphodiesterase [Sporolactobacillus sp. CQH2019]
MTMPEHYFLAIPVPDTIGRLLAADADRLRRTCTYRYWTDSRDCHITLFFFGALASEKLGPISHSMELLARETAPLCLTLSDMTGFGDQRHPRVIYADLEPSAELFRLRARAADRLSRQGLSLERRPFKPHITVAKKWSSGTAAAITAGDSPWRGLSWKADGMILYTVRPGRLPRYLPLKHFLFGG